MFEELAQSLAKAYGQMMAQLVLEYFKQLEAWTQFYIDLGKAYLEAKDLVEHGF
jgi:hypothetical protein